MGLLGGQKKEGEQTPADQMEKAKEQVILKYKPEKGKEQKIRITLAEKLIPVLETDELGIVNGSLKDGSFIVDAECMNYEAGIDRKSVV